MERLIFAVDETTELGDYRRKRPMFDVSNYMHPVLRVEAKVAIGAQW